MVTHSRKLFASKAFISNPLTIYWQLPGPFMIWQNRILCLSVSRYVILCSSYSKLLSPLSWSRIPRKNSNPLFPNETLHTLLKVPCYLRSVRSTKNWTWSSIRAQGNYEIFNKYLLFNVASYGELKVFFEGNPNRPEAILYKYHCELKATWLQANSYP